MIWAEGVDQWKNTCLACKRERGKNCMVEDK